MHCKNHKKHQVLPKKKFKIFFHLPALYKSFLFNFLNFIKFHDIYLLVVSDPIISIILKVLSKFYKNGISKKIPKLISWLHNFFPQSTLFPQSSYLKLVLKVATHGRHRGKPSGLYKKEVYKWKKCNNWFVGRKLIRNSRFHTLY